MDAKPFGTKQKDGEYLPKSIPPAKSIIPVKGKMQGISDIPSPTGNHKLTMAPIVRK